MAVSYNCINCMFEAAPALHRCLHIHYPIVKLLCESKFKKTGTRMLSLMDWIHKYPQTAEFYSSEVSFFAFSFNDLA